jgi:uncharacterized surface protein with fasciclin (FAS1) repeats
MKSTQIRASVGLLVVLLTFSLSFDLTAKGSNYNSGEKPILIAARTQQFKEKQGFEREPKDIINTLKNNEITSFHTLLDGLQQAFDLDQALKNKGPYTLFAPSDKAFKKLPAEDVQTLFANKKKLKQVLSYQIVKGQLNANALRSMKSVKTMEGDKINLSTKSGDLYADKSLILTTDIPCSNGIIHVLDEVIMPPLSK